MKLKIEFHAETKTYYGTRASLTKKLQTAVEDLDYRDHVLSYTRIEKERLEHSRNLEKCMEGN